MIIHNKRVIIFDFDGTLVDTAKILFRVFNNLAKRYQYQPISIEETLRLKNKDIKDLIHSHAKIPFWKLWAFTRQVKNQYRSYADTIELFPDIKSMIHSLQKRGYTIGIVSSNATDTISTLLKKFDISVEFISTSSIFGKAKTLNAISSKRHLDRAEVIYIGDEIRDVEACQKGNIDMLAVTWGFSSKDALQKTTTPTIDHPLEILEIFQGVTKV
ncbi:MAG: HAD-IA family hydrolase [Candidatus Moraniibacteriota bacterium]|nr:MAG: HAD-IA family hydrolase [Candidatus Moranbacteria bacterium]